MRPNVMEWVRKVAEENCGIWHRGRVLEVGSKNINGSVRPIFELHAAHYCGIDRVSGPGVDLVIDADNLPYSGDGIWNAVICTEMLEHVWRPHDIVTKLWAQVKDGGILILTTRGIGYGMHDEPEDYWRFTEHSMQKLVQGLSDDWHVKDDKEDQGVYGYAIKSKNK